MNLFLLYLLLLKATITSFSGLSSLPVIRADLVERHGVLTDHQLSTAVAAGRTGPGPLGLYVVSVGYQVAGAPGAAAGWLAMITPAFLIIPMLRSFGSRTEHPRIRGAIQAVLIASAGLLLSAAVPMGQEALTSSTRIFIAIVSAVVLGLTKVDTIWVILGAAGLGCASAWLGF